jgi:hypothetical protein
LLKVRFEFLSALVVVEERYCRLLAKESEEVEA